MLTDESEMFIHKLSYTIYYYFSILVNEKIANVSYYS